MDDDNIDSDILVVGAGPIGLYTALLLTKMGFSVRIIDKAKDASSNKNKAFLWSPRSLQLLNAVGVSETMLQDGYRHWKFETFANNGHGNQAANADHQSYRVWENEVTEFNWSLSYECHKVCEALIKALASHGVQVEYQQELINIEDGSPSCYQLDSVVLATIQNHASNNDENGNNNDNNDDNEVISHWKSRILVGADGKKSFVRQKLGIAQHRQRKSGVFYTMVATVTSNFTGTRMSLVTKGQHAVFIVGHGQKMYFMFEHQPRWSQLTIDDPVPVAKAQRHIKSIMDPFQIEFTKVHSYFSWSAESRSCEEYVLDRRFFLVGGSAQSIEPPGLLSTNLGLEQAQNLCWKLYLHLHRRASPLLLDTYEDESRSKLDDVLAASQAFVQLISNRSPSTSEEDEDPTIHPHEQTHKIQKNRPCLVGETPYQTNLINLGTASNFSLAISESNTITAAAQMMQHHADPGAVGSLAQNARLKPYTMIQILLSQSNLCTKPNNIKSMTTEELVPPPPSPTFMSSTPISPPTTPSPVSSNKKASDGRPRSLSSTTTSTSSGWSLAKLHIVTKKAKQYYSNGQHSSQQQQQEQQQPGDKSDGTATGTKCTTPTTPSATSERWKRIRPNYYHLLDRMGWEYSEVTFTILVFCGNIHEDEKCMSTLRKLRRYLDSPNSFIHRYETHHQQHYHHNRQSLVYCLPMTTAPLSATTASVTPSLSPPALASTSVLSSSPPAEPNHRASVSSFTSSHRSSFSYPTNTRSSYSAFSIPPSSPTSITTNMTRFSTITTTDARPSFSSACFDDEAITSVQSSPPAPRLSEDTRATSFSSSTSSSHSASTISPPLFSFLYVTTSSKNDVIKCLQSTPSAVIHAAFPFGLDKVYLDHDYQCHNAFNSNPTKTKSPTMVVIRPDGYVGARVRLNDEQDVDRLDAYFDSFLRPHYDQNSAAALIAAAYDDDC